MQRLLDTFGPPVTLLYFQTTPNLLQVWNGFSDVFRISAFYTVDRKAYSKTVKMEPLHQSSMHFLTQTLYHVMGTSSLRMNTA